MAKRGANQGQPTQLDNGAVVDPNNPTPFGGRPGEAVIDPRVTDPAALAYAKRAAARAKLTKYTTPRGGEPTPPIPRLDMEPVIEGGTMADNARRNRELGMQIASGQFQAPGGTVVQGVVPQQVHQRTVGGAAKGPQPQVSVQTGDLLPEPATRDPLFRHGHGSAFAINQPHLAAKYGVVRGGQHIPPQQLLAGAAAGAAAGAVGKPPPPNDPNYTAQTGQLRPETVKGLEALQEFQKQQEQVEQQVLERPAQERVENSALGKSVGVTEPPMTDDEKRRVLEDIDDFDLGRARTTLMKDMLNNEAQRKIVESRLKPLDLSEMVDTGYVTQIVPIKPGFEPIFRSYTADEDLAIKRLIMDDLQTYGEVGDRYTIDKYTLMGLTVALHGLNNKPLPSFRDAEGNWNDDLFWKKFNKVSKFNYHMTASLAINWFWFDLRVRELFVMETLGNG